MEKSPGGPWPDVATARLFLSHLVDLASGTAGADSGILERIAQNANGGWPAISGWLTRHQLATLAISHMPALSERREGALRQTAFESAALQGIHQQNLATILDAFEAAGIEVVLLKGTALASQFYHSPEQRSMSDIDFWVEQGKMAQAVAAMQGAGFQRQAEKEDRPLALQALSMGEISFYRLGWQGGLVELHWSPFPGWWMYRTTQIDLDKLWAARIPIRIDDRDTHQLAAEDMFIQVAAHLTVSHQSGRAAVRSIMDLAVLARGGELNWDLVAGKASSWRVATSIWLALRLANQIVGMPGSAEAEARLRPGLLRRWLIKWLISPEAVLSGRDIRQSTSRFLYLLLLVDKRRDLLRLVWRTVWPEPEWLLARYGQPTSRWQHLRKMISSRSV